LQGFWRGTEAFWAHLWLLQHGERLSKWWLRSSSPIIL
jgi:hypothetical protein